MTPTMQEMLEALKQRSCDDQFEIATALASNVGYVLQPEPSVIETGAWRPIEEACGDRIVGYIKYAGNHHHVGECEWFRDHYEFSTVPDDFDIFPAPTHFTPLPTPPEASS